MKKLLLISILIIFNILLSTFYSSAQSVFDVIKSWNFCNSGCYWKAIACGDINGDGIDEFAAIKADTSQFMVFSSPTYDKTLNLTGCLKLIDTIQNNFIGITIGKFIDYGDSTRQIAVLRKTSDTLTPNILIYRQLGYSSFQLVASGVSGSSSRQWIGCTAGDIDGDGLDELIVCKRDSAQFTAYGISSGGAFTIKGIINIDTNSSGAENDWRGVACKDFDNDGKAELIAAREGNSAYPDVVMWRFNSGTFNNVIQFNPGGSTHSNWLGIATGTFESNTPYGSDFVLYKNSSPFFQYYHYDYSVNAINLIGSNDYNSDIAYPWLIAAGNTDKENARDEVVALHKYSIANPANIDMIGDKLWNTYDQIHIQTARDTNYNFNSNAAATFIRDNNIQTFDFLISEYFVRSALGAPNIDPVIDTTIMGTEYGNFINFLDATKNTAIKVWITLIPPTEANYGGTNHSGSFPMNTGKIKNQSGIIIDETTYFNKFLTYSYPNPLDYWDTTYGGWFTLCNLIAKQYPNFTGIRIDDFSRYNNLLFFRATQPDSNSLLEDMYKSLKANHADVAFIPISDWKGLANAPDTLPNNQPWWEPYADGLVYPYCNMSHYASPCHYDNSTTNTYNYEISHLKTWWNSATKPIFTCVYASPLSCIVDSSLTFPSQSYVDTLMNYGKSSTDGVTIYCTLDSTTAIGCTVYTNFSTWANQNYNCNTITGLPNTAISNNKNQEDLVIVYPNPANDNLIVEIKDFRFEILDLRIEDIVGNTVLEKSLLNNKTNLDVSALAGGMYFIKVRTEKGVESRKFIKL